MEHTHTGEVLTVGCPTCSDRVRGDQFWARINAESSEREDPEFGLPPSMMLHLIEVEEEDEAEQHMRYIPNWMLSVLLDECGQSVSTISDYAMREAARRIPSNNETRP
jgi:hypothetical protein